MPCINLLTLKLSQQPIFIFVRFLKISYTPVLTLFLIGVLGAISDLGDLVFRLLGLSWISGLPVLASFSAPFIVLSVSASILLVVLVVVVVGGVLDIEMF